MKITWRKSTRSNSNSGQQSCVEVASLPAGIGLRDSKNPTAGHLSLTPQTFRHLLERLKDR
ncbi:DUF397 domain-containing protein [Thermomonospora umbrina]|uniref:Uncharacterized protein DUF397 n=1 Tax=Thermomonospora umbrina TaxID=111806 RepID=A0A3D9SPZ7_9ACTN|nr:DUF397 domain-containing protein [Thermomonospora umbrina]REE97687.1 uncharacterized protein DUF397 [Thermomonospora umbrina]